MLFINVFKGIRVHITILRIFMYNFFILNQVFNYSSNNLLHVFKT